MQKKEGSLLDVEFRHIQQRSKSVATDAHQLKCLCEKYSICNRFYPIRSLSSLQCEAWKSEHRFDVTVEDPGASRSNCLVKHREQLYPDVSLSDPALVCRRIVACNRSNNINMEIDSTSNSKKNSAASELLLPFNIVSACDQVIENAIQNYRRRKEMRTVNKIRTLGEVVIGRKGGLSCRTAGYKLCQHMENQWVMMPEKVLPLHSRMTSEKPPHAKNCATLKHPSMLQHTKITMASYMCSKSLYKAPYTYVSEKNLVLSSPRAEELDVTPEGSLLPPQSFSPQLASAFPPPPPVSPTVSSASPPLPSRLPQSASNEPRHGSEITLEKAGPLFMGTPSFAKAKEKAHLKLNVITVNGLKRGYGPWFLSSIDSGKLKTHQIRRLLASEAFPCGSSPNQEALTCVSQRLTALAGKGPGKKNKKESNVVPLTIYPTTLPPPTIPLYSTDTGRHDALRFVGRVEGVLYPQSFVPKRNPNSAMPNTAIVELRIPSPKLQTEAP